MCSLPLEHPRRVSSSGSAHGSCAGLLCDEKASVGEVSVERPRIRQGRSPRAEMRDATQRAGQQLDRESERKARDPQHQPPARTLMLSARSRCDLGAEVRKDYDGRGAEDGVACRAAEETQGERGGGRRWPRRWPGIPRRLAGRSRSRLPASQH